MARNLRTPRWLFALAAILNGCPSAGSTTPSSADQAAPTPTETTTSDESSLPSVDITDVRVSTGDLLVPYASHPEKLEVSSLYSGIPFTITLVGTDGGVAEIDGTNVPLNTPYSVSLPKIGHDVDVHIRHRDATGALIDETLSTVPADYPAYSITNDDALPGRIFVTPYSWTDASLVPYSLMLDESGTPLFYLRSVGDTIDFKSITLPNGKLRYSYYLDGRTYVLDEQFALLQTVQLVPSARHDVLPTEAHEFVLLDDDHWILSAYQTKQVSNVPSALTGDNAQPWVIASVLQEVRAGLVVFEWDSSEHPELYDHSSDGNDFAHATATTPADYVHFNALAVDPSDGNWLVSLRHQDAILKIRTSDGSIAWTLGGAGDEFGLEGAQRFSHQHAVRVLSDGRLIFFDNGNASGATRIVELGLDAESKTLTSFTSLAANRYSYAMGYVERFDDRYFIGWGAHDSRDEPDVTEIDASTGAVHFSLRFDEARFSYRAFKRR